LGLFFYKIFLSTEYSKNNNLWEENMAIELNKKGGIKWTIGDRIFNIVMVLLFGWGDFLGSKPKRGYDEE